MAAANTWPGAVPHKIRRNDYRGARPFLPPLKSDMQAGNSRARRQHTVAIGRITGSIYMTDGQFRTFRGWVRDDLSHGTLPFNVPVYFPVDGYITKECFFSDFSYGPEQREGVGWSVPVDITVIGF